MSDESRRRKQREALIDPTEENVAAAAREEARSSVHSFHSFVEKWVLIEGAKMNYYGKVRAVINQGSGRPDLVMHPLMRVGNWSDSGPEGGLMRSSLEEPRILNGDGILEIGLAFKEWDLLKE